jgi:membrane associated rhomboid family serine protease
MSYGFIPANGNLTTAFTYMFLHGSFFHLLGNMVFLWLVGCVLELGCGRVFYSASYLLTGLLSVGLFWLIYTTSGTPLVGASGAISGLIGLYTVLYGKQRIKVFISLGFYFNYLKAPAIVLLPVWIANEIFQLFFGGASNVAYVAHIGGLGAGAFLGFLNLKYLGQVDKKIFERDPVEEIPSLMETALQHIAKLDMNGARPHLERVLEIDPMHRDALRHLFNVDKLQPQSEQFHKTASRLLRFLIHTKDDPVALLATYKEYCQHAKSLRLSPELWFSIASALSTNGHPQDAEKIMGMLIRKHPGFQKVPTGILSLARGYLKMGMSDKAKKCLHFICQKYPQSDETHAARRLLGETT